MKAASEGRTVRNLREEEMVKFRRELYRLGIRVRNVRDGGRSRDTTAEFYLRNPACLHRLVPWLKRELNVLYGAHGSLVNIVQHIIMSRITHHDMEDGAIQEELRPFLQGRTEHFLHEFISFAKSPFNMEAYDRHAVYDCPAPSSEDGSSNSSVIAISEDEQESLELNPPGDSMSSDALSQSAWDDETPGPSYSTTTEWSRVQQLSVPDSSDSSVEEQTRGGGVSPQHRSPHIKSDSSPGAVNNDGCLSSDDDDDCVIVGFVKPAAERTPELVQLSSDSEESVHEMPQLPQHIRFTSVSPPASHSKDQGSGGSDRVLKERNRSGSKERWSPSMSRGHEPSSRSERKNRGHHDKDGRRHHSDDRSKERRRSRSRDRRRSFRNTDHSRSTRSPVISANSDGTFSRGRRHSHSSSRERSYSRLETPVKRRDRELGHSGCNQKAQSHTYNVTWQSYSHYSWDKKDNSGTHFSERRSYYSSCHKNPDQRSHSRSRSRSRESHRRDRRRSMSRSYSGSGSPSTKKKSRHDKPGGKRKYKTRHLEEPAKNASSKSHPECDSSTSCTKDKKSKEKHRKKTKEKSWSRSLSVEIVYEGSSSEQTKKHQKKKKKHKKKSKRHKSKERTEKRLTSVITIGSDSDDSAKDTVTQASSTDNDNPIKSTIGYPPDSTPLESMLQELENQILVGLDKDMSNTGSPQVTETSGNIVGPCDVPHSEGEKSLKDDLKGHISSNANTRIS